MSEERVNLASRESVEREKVKSKDARKQELNDIRTVLSNVSGKRLLWRLMSKCGTFKSTFNREPSTMSYLAGQQDLGHFIMSEIINADPNLMVKLMKDNGQKEQ